MKYHIRITSLVSVLLVVVVVFAVGAVSQNDIARLKAKIVAGEQLTAGDLSLANQVGLMPEVQRALASEKARAAGVVETYTRPRNPLDDYSWTPTTFNWVDISASGTATGIVTDDGQGGPFNIGFTFPFYGGNYTQVWADANGIVSFAAITGFNESNGTLPSTATPNLALYPFWDDLTPNVNGTIRYLADAANNRFIMAWIGVGHYSGGTTPETFEVIITPSGSITYQYQIVGANGSCTVGIENSDGTQGVQICANGAGTLPANGVAWLISQAPGIPQAPTNLTGGYAGGQVTLNWTNPTLDTQGNPVTVDSLQVWLGSIGGTYLGRVLPPLHGFVHANSTPGSYTYVVRAFHGTNAGAAASVPVVVGSPTYNNNFDVDNGMWVADPPTGGWEWGAPTAAGGPTAHSGANVWGTVLAANYPDNACFNLTLSLGLTVASASATVEFWGWYQVESSYDGCAFQVSTDQGASWTVVQPQGNYPGTTNTAQTCMPSTPAWTNSTIVPWTHYVIPIGQFNGQVVQFRFKFGTDGSVTYPGFYFDDMIIWGLSDPRHGNVSGTVELTGGHGNVSDVTVATDILSILTHPSGTGSYSLDNVPIGNRTITASLPGYTTRAADVYVADSAVTTLDFTLDCIFPEIPEHVSATDTIPSWIRITWDPQTNVDSFQIRRDGLRIAAISGSENTFIDSSTASCRSYQYTVEAFNQCGASQISLPDGGSRGTSVPSQVANVQCSDGLCGRTEITWSDLPNDTFYVVWRSLSNGHQPVVVAPSLPQNTTSFEDTTGVPFTVYRYWVMAGNPCGTGPASAYNFGFSVPGLAAPQECRASDSVNCGYVTVSWNEAIDALGYYVYRNDTLIDSVDVGMLQYLDHAVRPSAAYTYSVRAFNDDCGAGPSSNHDIGVAWGAPDIVSNLMATDTLCSEIKVQWASVARADSVVVLRNSVQIGIVRRDTLWFADTSAIPGTGYMYSVVAVNRCGSSNPSPADSGLRAAIPHMLSLSAEGDNCDHVTIHWTASPNADSLHLYRDGIHVGTMPAESSSFVDEVNSPGSYYYLAYATNSCGLSVHSDTVNANVLAFPSAPSHLAFTDNHCNSITMTWNPSQGAFGRYRIYRESTLIGTVPNSQTTFVDSTVLVGMTYLYYVRAANDTCGESNSSNMVSAALSDPDDPQLPDVTIAVITPDVHLRWHSVHSTQLGCPLATTGYLVYYAPIVDGPYYYHGFTTDTAYVHRGVVSRASGRYYIVTAYAGPLELLYTLSSGATKDEVSRQLGNGRY